MKPYIIFCCLLIAVNLQLLAQTPKKHPLVDSINKLVEAEFRPNKGFENPTTLEGCLRRDYPQKIAGDRWVYYPGLGNIHKIELQKLSHVIPNSLFYKVRFTNFTGLHRSQSDCFVIFDSVKMQTTLIEPLRYSDMTESFLKKFIGIELLDSVSLTTFVKEIQVILIPRPFGQIIETTYTKDKVSFNLSLEGINYGDVWRTYEIEIKDGRLVRIKEINPRTGQANIYQ